MNGAIFFASKYGSTAQYAEWIDIPVQVAFTATFRFKRKPPCPGWQVGGGETPLSLNVEPDIADVFYMVKPMWGRELSFQ
jgi:hypothetical protein